MALAGGAAEYNTASSSSQPPSTSSSQPKDEDQEKDKSKDKDNTTFYSSQPRHLLVLHISYLTIFTNLSTAHKVDPFVLQN